MTGSKYIKEAGIVMIPTNCQNWLALGACVYADMSVSKALRMLGLVNFTKGVKQNHRKPIDVDRVKRTRNDISENRRNYERIIYNNKRKTNRNRIQQEVRK